MIRKLVAAFVMILFAASLHSTAFAEFIPVDGDTKRLDDGNFKAGDIIRETGYGQAPSNWDQRDSFSKTFARQAARIDALRNFVQLIAIINFFNSTMRVNADDKMDSDYLKITLSQDSKTFKLIEKNARVVGVKFLDDGVCEVTMEIVFPTDWHK